MILNEFPPSAAGEFHVDQEKGLLRGANLRLCRHASKAGAELTDKGQIVPLGPGGLHQQLDALLIHLVQRPQSLL